MASRDVQSSLPDIPDRETLASMSRSDLQMLCKRHNIKANLRSDKMVNALCNLIVTKVEPEPVASLPPLTPRPDATPPPSTSTQLRTGHPVFEPFVPDSETRVLAARVADLETKMIIMPALEESAAQISSLHDEISRLDEICTALTTDVQRYLNANEELRVRTTNLEKYVQDLLKENASLRDDLKSLETRPHHQTPLETTDKKDEEIPYYDLTEPDLPEVKEGQASQSNSIPQPLHKNEASNHPHPPSSSQQAPSMTTIPSAPTPSSRHGDRMGPMAMTANSNVEMRPPQSSLRASGRTQRDKRFNPYSVPPRPPCASCAWGIPLPGDPFHRSDTGTSQPRCRCVHPLPGPFLSFPSPPRRLPVFPLPPHKAHHRPHAPVFGLHPVGGLSSTRREPAAPAPNIMEGPGGQASGPSGQPLRLTYG